MSHKIKDRNRRLLNYKTSKVKEVLPEFFHSEYPTFVQFLEAYYDFMDSDASTSYDTEIHNLYSLRDISETPTKYLNQLISELGSGLANGDVFTDPRFSAKRFADLYREKGSEKSLKEFFRAFFGQEVEIVYPKNNLFIVGESRVGTDSLRYIQDYAKYQLYSIVLRVGLGVDQYKDLYKKFIHPAGWYFEGEAFVTEEAILSPFARAWQDSTDVWIEAEDPLSLVSEVVLDDPELSPSQVGVYDSVPNQFSGNIDINFISEYQSKTIEELDRFFVSSKELYSINSFKFDDSDDTVNNGPDFSMEYDSYVTFDRTMFGRYQADSAF